MSARNPLDTSKFTITAEDFKDELDHVLAYVQLASARCDLPTLDDLFVEADSNRYWLLCYAVRFAARCAAQRGQDIAQDVAGEAMEADGRDISSRGWSRQVFGRLAKLRQPEDDTDTELN